MSDWYNNFLNHSLLIYIGKEKKTKNMKAIIYAGIGLFSIATVYGVTDYYSSNKKGTLDKLYMEKEMPKAASEAEVKTTVEVPVKDSEVKTVVNKTTAIKTRPVKKIKKIKRELKFENFSRARIPEFIKDDSITVPLKKGKQ
jgi:hypothetical protein